jgi:succinyl-CoA synthetase beta subunit
MQIKGIPVKSVWIEEKIQIKRELYFGITTDRFNQSYVAVSSAVGGMEIEEVAKKKPRKGDEDPHRPTTGPSPIPYP